MNADKKMIEQSIQPISLLATAREQGASLEKLEQLMEMQFKWEANEAKKAYHKAVADFKSEPVRIPKSKRNSQFGGSPYSGIDDLVNTVNPVLGNHGLSAHWSIDQSEGIKVTCVLTHSLGHSESVSMTGPADKSGAKSPIQEIKSTITYLKIATYEAVTGVASSDDPGDTDGNIPEKSIDARQVVEIEKLIKLKQADKSGFLLHFSIEEIKDLPKAKYSKATQMLRDKK